MVREPRYPPVITGIVIGICAYIFGAILREGPISPDGWARYWVYLYPFPVWDGRYWTLLTSAFIHQNVFHMLFNLVLIWALAGRLEQIYGHQATFAVLFFGAILTDGAQFAASGVTGIGLSGVVFALFGWMWSTRNQVPDLRRFLTPGITRLLMGWLVLVVGICQLGAWPTGNASHAAGLLFGLAVGHVFYQDKPAVRFAGAGTMATLGVFVVLGLTCAFWSGYWPSWRYMQAHKRNNPVQVSKVEHDILASDDPVTLNTAAWIMATSNDAQLRNGRRAVELARRACELTQWTEPGYMDTLAAAYAETEDWKQATEIQQRVQSMVVDKPALKQPEYAMNLDRIARREKIRQ